MRCTLLWSVAFEQLLGRILHTLPTLDILVNILRSPFSLLFNELGIESDYRFREYR
jgi:hypothetical protein